jgi:hypothetical protein
MEPAISISFMVSPWDGSSVGLSWVVGAGRKGSPVYENFIRKNQITLE